MRIGDAVRQLRVARGYTQEALAEKAAMKQSTISRIESNRGLPSPDKFQPLAQALGVPVSRFFSDVSDEKKESEDLGDDYSLVQPSDHFMSTISLKNRVRHAARAEDYELSSRGIEDSRIIEAYKKLEPGSTRKMAVDILLFAKKEDDDNS
jgi:transcriptional regulator with XRE-family HTH domain